jgi:hypothetical protein
MDCLALFRRLTRAKVGHIPRMPPRQPLFGLGQRNGPLMARHHPLIAVSEGIEGQGPHVAEGVGLSHGKDEFTERLPVVEALAVKL